MSNIHGLGTCVVIHGKGNKEFQAVINGVVSKEWEQQRKTHEKEMEWMNMIKTQRDRDRYQRLQAYAAQRVKIPREQVKEKIGFVLACLLCWGEALHMWEYIGNKEEKK